MYNASVAEKYRHGISLHRSRHVFGLLQECIEKRQLDSGRKVQALLQEHRLDEDAYWGDHLIRLFGVCEKLEEADSAFRKVRKPSTYTWSAIISAHVELSENKRGLELFFDMLLSGTQPNRKIFLSALKSCRKLGSSFNVKLVHDKVIRCHLKSDKIITNALVDTYSKCGNLAEALVMFNVIQNPDVVAWCALINGYAAHGKGLDALHIFQQMLQGNTAPDRIIFSSILKACGTIHAAYEVMMIHEQVIRSGYESDLFIGSSLVDVYARCGCLQEAHAVFDNLKNKNAVSWAALIMGYAQHGEGQCSMELLERMHLENVDIDRIAFVSIIKACSSVGGLKQGRLLNKKMLEKGLFPDNLLGNALVDMYSRCGDLDDASCIFKRLLVQDVVSWGAIIAGYDGCGFSFEALSLFDQMQQAGVQANTAVFLPVLNACSFLNYVEHGMLIHGQLVEQNEMMDMAIANKLVDMYTKTGKIEEAESVFRAMEYRDLVSWGAMILGCADHGHGSAALDFFQEMWQECIEADKTIFLCVLKACASTSAIKLARLIHFQVVASGHNDDREIENTLLDTYSKLGSIDDSCRVFDGLVGPDTVSWAAMIAGYARCGILQTVHQCLKDMKQQGLQPHAGIFSSVLLGCTHAGVLNEGYQFFKSMINEYGITPNVEHYHCIVDLLGRVGQLKEAIAMLVTMPAMSDMIVWTSLLTSCKTYHNVELGKVCLDEILRIDPDDASAYLLMASIYADAGMWEEVRRLRVLRQLAGAQKKRGVTFLEVDNKVYEFVVGEKCASMIEPVYLKAERINRLLRSSAYLPQVESVVDLPSMEL